MTKNSKNKVDSVLDELLAKEEQFSDENFSYAGMRLSSAGMHPDSLSIPSFMGVNFDELDDEFVEDDAEEAAAFLESETFSEEYFDPDIVVIQTIDEEMACDDSDEEFFELDTNDFEEAESSKRSSRGLPTLFSFGGKRILTKTPDGKHLKQAEVLEEGEAIRKKPFAIVSKAKEFWRNDVYPLFMEVDETSSTEEEASAEDFSNAEDAAEIEVLEGGFSAKEMFSSVKEKAVHAGKTVWSFMNEKVTHPLLEKLRLDSEDDYIEAESEQQPKGERHLKLLKRREPINLQEGEEFVDEEIIDEEKPTFFERLRRVLGEDDYDDDYYYEDESEEEMSFFEAIKYLFKDEETPNEVDGNEPEVKTKGRFAGIIQKAFFVSEAEDESDSEVKTGEVVGNTKFNIRAIKRPDKSAEVETSEFVLPGMLKKDESIETEEEDDFRVIPDQDIFDEVMREKAARIAAANAEDQAQN